jgi:hypothetical protein
LVSLFREPLIAGVGQRDMTSERPRIRIEEDDVNVALAPEQFEQRIRELLPEDEIKDLPSPIVRIVYWRGDLPRRRMWVERLWWLVAMGAGLVLLYGLYSLAQKGLNYITR